MQYQLDSGDGPDFQPGWTSVNFVRPAHGLVALHGADVVPVRALGLQAGRQTRGHRFEAAVDPVVLQHADHYERQLEEQGAVIASFAARRAEIVRQLGRRGGARVDLSPIDDDALLDEVTALVERPNVLLCRFEDEFLAVPPECLILTMKANQKYFPLLDADGRLDQPLPHRQQHQPGRRQPRRAGQRARGAAAAGRRQVLLRPGPQEDAGVARAAARPGGLPRQARQPGRARRARARHRACHRRTARRRALAAEADRAAVLAKADLLTDMVGEFPELQGIMGGYYARHDGETEAVALAVEDHYKPRFAGDALPRGEVGVVVALADKLETLAGLFGIGQVPTGDKDPFALRRHAFGIIRMLVERRLPLAVPVLVDTAFEAFPRPPRPMHAWR